jgi:hypothetical protein
MKQPFEAKRRQGNAPTASSSHRELIPARPSKTQQRKLREARGDAIDLMDLFGEPDLIRGEYWADFLDTYAAFIDTAKPRDYLEHAFLRSAVDAFWERNRYRRWQAAFVNSHLPHGLFELLVTLGPSGPKAKNAHIALAQGWARRDKNSCTTVKKRLSPAKFGIDEIAARAAGRHLDELERLTTLAVGAEARWAAALRELDRHRSTLGRAVREAASEIEDASFEPGPPPPVAGPSTEEKCPRESEPAAEGPPNRVVEDTPPAAATKLFPRDDDEWA